jgi:hypothetical protein
MKITNKQSNHTGENGQVVLTIVVLMVVMILITTAATFSSIANTHSAYVFQEGNRAYDLAETGMENALLRLLRSPTYTGETLTVGDGTVVVTKSGTTLTSTATLGSFVRKIQVVIVYNNNILTVSTWKEIF